MSDQAYAGQLVATRTGSLADSVAAVNVTYYWELRKLVAQKRLVVARDLVDKVENAELFLYPGDGHLFADSSLSDFDEEAAALLKERIHGFLARVG